MITIACTVAKLFFIYIFHLILPSFLIAQTIVDNLDHVFSVFSPESAAKSVKIVHLIVWLQHNQALIFLNQALFQAFHS